MNAPGTQGALLVAEGWIGGYAMPVVGPLDFAIHAGEVVGLTGPNGCGKSTVIAGIVGTARSFAGRLVAQARGIACQEQIAPGIDGMPFCVRDLLRLNRASEEALPAWLIGKLDTRLDRLSGGQLQLLRVWLNLQGDAQLVLLDEPTNNLDAHGITLLVDMLRGIDTRRAVMLVSHEADFLEQACTRQIKLNAR